MHAVLESVVRKFSRELDGLDADTSRQHPQGKSYLWSVQEVIEHLVLSYSASTKELEARLVKGRVSRQQRRTPLQWLLQLMVLSFGHIPRGTPAMDDTMPVSGTRLAMDGEDLTEFLRRQLEDLDAALDRSRRQFGMERVAAHPFLGPMRVDQWRRFHVLHSMHHLEQVLRIRSQVMPPVVQEKAFNLALAKELRIPVQRSLT